MNYQKIYNQLIERAKTRVLEGYKERHHIIPKCLGGSNDPTNLVELTAREHFLSHQLLCEIYPKKDKLKYALWYMANVDKVTKRYGSSSRKYEQLRIMFSNIKRSKKTRQKMSNSHLGKKMSKESIAKSVEHRKQKIKQFSLDGTYIRDWDSIKEANESLNIKVGVITNVCQGKHGSAGGYKWAYKDEDLKKSIRIARPNHVRPLLQFENKILIKEWKSMKEAIEFYKLDRGTLNRAINKNKLYREFHWNYKYI